MSGVTATSSGRSLRVLQAPQTKGHRSVSRVTSDWYVACETRELGSAPLARTILGVPLVLFRSSKSAAATALLDRCPHRNVPLSLGRVAEGTLECAYHGWRFDGAGGCVHVPSLGNEREAKARNATAFPVLERDGVVWVWMNPDVKPDREPYALPLVSAAGYSTLRTKLDVRGTLHATLENALDVPHTAFLHKGLFRAESRGIEIQANVKRSARSVEAEYVGEPRPTGFVARMLSPSGGIVTHYDRFHLPSIAQVEYRLGEENHFTVTTIMTPIEDFLTRQFVIVSFKLRLVPGWLAKLAIKPFAMRIFQQDAAVLSAQSDAIERFGGEQFVSTEIDVLGKHIWRLMKHAERGPEAGPLETAEESVTLVV